jgi:hypothetical protein
MWKEPIVKHQNTSEGTDKNHGNLNQNRQDCQFLGRDFNPKSPEYTTELIHLTAMGDMLPRYSVRTRRSCSAEVP